MTPSEPIERISADAADAIASLGDRRRLEILVALAAAERSEGTAGTSLSFSTLYDATDVESSSQFAYHLDQLVGPFVERTPDGYRLTYTGGRIARAVRAGLYEPATSFDDEPVGGTCIRCGSASLVATVADEGFHIHCRACEETLLSDIFPRSQARGRTAAEIVESFGHRIWGSLVQLRAGVCPECAGRVETSVTTTELGGRTLYTHASTCPECWFGFALPVEAVAVFHPAAANRLWMAGIDLWDVPLWELFEFIVSDSITTDVSSRDPLGLRFEVALEGDRLELEMDESGSVTVA
ncbi:DUF7351 domain-containing protein [Halovivax gelatinilyticus]|uniref:DUF7351 domain-containing protein n=1 Tax=Halovivax gelatinilyticus TaxID=2961597 RepID=UPI0020CA8D85|nr:ArsR family transcriptional regulator [Halovivax gelatinilyticus]